MSVYRQLSYAKTLFLSPFLTTSYSKLAIISLINTFLSYNYRPRQNYKKFQIWRNVTKEARLTFFSFYELTFKKSLTKSLAVVCASIDWQSCPLIPDPSECCDRALV